MKKEDRRKALTVETLRTNLHRVASPRIAETGEGAPARPEGLEPPTLGSEDRCSIQLSYGRFAFFPVFFAASRGILEVVSDALRL